MSVAPLTFRRSSETFVREIGIRDTEEETYTRGSILHEYFAYPPEGYDGPQAFLGRLGPQSRSGAHFHPVDQFQVFFGHSDGWYQRETLDDVLIHYADAFTTYGPFGARTEDLRYFTLRRRWTDVVRYMPGSQEAIPPDIGHRNRRYHLPPREERQQVLKESGRCEIVELGTEPDGTGAWFVMAGPDVTFPVPHTLSGGGMYIVLLSGKMRIDDASYGTHDIGWVDPQQEIPKPVATDDEGLEALFLQFRS